MPGCIALCGKAFEGPARTCFVIAPLRALYRECEGAACQAGIVGTCHGAIGLLGDEDGDWCVCYGVMPDLWRVAAGEGVRSPLFANGEH